MAGKKKSNRYDDEEPILYPPPPTSSDIMNEEEAKRRFEEELEYNPPKAVDLPTVDVGAGGDNVDLPQTLRDAINQGSDLTDMQFAADKLFPSKLGPNKIHNALMVSRIDPNAFLPMLHLNAIDRIMRCNYREKINVNDIYMETYTLLSIGLDGEGRIDQLELAGAAREEKRLQNTFGANPIH